MEKYFAVLKKCAMFEGLDKEEMMTFLKCLNARAVNYRKNQVIFDMGRNVKDIGIVLKGNVHVTSLDASGERRILIELKEGKSFAEFLAFSGMQNPAVYVAAAPSTILLFPAKKILDPCADACKNHKKILDNTFRLISEKILMLHMKNHFLSQKTTRDKLMAYLKHECKSRIGVTFRIPFSREQLAEYLCVNQSAMSRELGKMRESGLLEFKRNNFRLKASQ